MAEKRVPVLLGGMHDKPIGTLEARTELAGAVLSAAVDTSTGEVRYWNLFLIPVAERERVYDPPLHVTHGMEPSEGWPPE